MEIITRLDQILRPKGKNWQVISPNAVLKEFLGVGGDYAFWVADPTAPKSTSGGNLINWKLEKDIVELTHQFDSSDVCHINYLVLQDAIEKLATSRRIREKYAKIQEEWDAHHSAWLIDPTSCPADKKRKNCSDGTHLWFQNNMSRKGFES